MAALGSAAAATAAVIQLLVAGDSLASAAVTTSSYDYVGSPDDGGGGGGGADVDIVGNSVSYAAPSAGPPLLPPLLQNDSSSSGDGDASGSLVGSFFTHIDKQWKFAEVIFIIVVSGILNLVTIVGNIMVLISFKMDRSLQTVSNYFLLSLALADLLIGLISMPLYTLYLLLNYWPLGPLMCDIWLAIDYLNSNAAVLNMLIISFDRYFSVTRPLTYRAKRTTKHACLMISCAWILSLTIWTPAIFTYPYYKGRTVQGTDKCEIEFVKANTYLTFVTAILAFYIPVIIMIYLYWRIWLETKKRYRDLTTLFLVSGVGAAAPVRTSRPASGGGGGGGAAPSSSPTSRAFVPRPAGRHKSSVASAARSPNLAQPTRRQSNLNTVAKMDRRNKSAPPNSTQSDPPKADCKDEQQPPQEQQRQLRCACRCAKSSHHHHRHHHHHHHHHRHSGGGGGGGSTRQHRHSRCGQCAGQPAPSEQQAQRQKQQLAHRHKQRCACKRAVLCDEPQTADASSKVFVFAASGGYQLLGEPAAATKSSSSASIMRKVHPEASSGEQRAEIGHAPQREPEAAMPPASHIAGCADDADEQSQPRLVDTATSPIQFPSTNDERQGCVVNVVETLLDDEQHVIDDRVDTDDMDDDDDECDERDAETRIVATRERLTFEPLGNPNGRKTSARCPCDTHYAPASKVTPCKICRRRQSPEHANQSEPKRQQQCKACVSPPPCCRYSTTCKLCLRASQRSAAIKCPPPPPPPMAATSCCAAATNSCCATSSRQDENNNNDDSAVVSTLADLPILDLSAMSRRLDAARPSSDAAAEPDDTDDGGDDDGGESTKPRCMRASATTATTKKITQKLTFSDKLVQASDDNITQQQQQQQQQCTMQRHVHHQHRHRSHAHYRHHHHRHHHHHHHEQPQQQQSQQQQQLHRNQKPSAAQPQQQEHLEAHAQVVVRPCAAKLSLLDNWTALGGLRNGAVEGAAHDAKLINQRRTSHQQRIDDEQDDGDGDDDDDDGQYDEDDAYRSQQARQQHQGPLLTRLRHLLWRALNWKLAHERDQESAAAAAVGLQRNQSSTATSKSFGGGAITVHQNVFAPSAWLKALGDSPYVPARLRPHRAATGKSRNKSSSDDSETNTGNGIHSHAGSHTSSGKHQQTPYSSYHPIQPKSERKAAKTLSTLLLVFIVTWLPYNVLVLIKTLSGGEDQVPERVWNFSYYLCYINSTINPLCYALCNAQFRRTYMRILKCKLTNDQHNSSRRLVPIASSTTWTKDLRPTSGSADAAHNNHHNQHNVHQPHTATSRQTSR